MSSELLYRFPSSPTTSPPNSGEHLPVRDFQSSTDTVHRTHIRKFSDFSVDSSSPAPHGAFLLKNENLVPAQQALQSTLRYHNDSTNFSWRTQISKPGPQHPSVQNETPTTPQTPRSPASTLEIDSLVDIDLNAGCGEDACSDEAAAGDMSGGFQPRLSFDPTLHDTLETRKSQSEPNADAEKESLSIGIPVTTKYPFRRWMRSLRYRSPGHKLPNPKTLLTVRQQRWSLEDFEEKSTVKSTPAQRRKLSGHKKASSWSSSGLVTAVKSATVGLAAPQSPKAKRLSLLRSSQRSSGASQATNRGSFESHASPRIMDEAAWERARQRRRTIEELVESEESYVADLKVLVNVRFLNSYVKGIQADRYDRTGIHNLIRIVNQCFATSVGRDT